MTQFNTKTEGSRKTVNHEGADAYSLTPELELYTLVVTTNFSEKFYEGKQERVQRLRELITKVKPEFVAQLAVYAREEMYLRSIPLVLAVELAAVHQGDDLVSRLVSRIVQRPDEITETLAYYSAKNERKETKKLGKLSKQIQLGLRKAFLKFDEYQFGKYDREGAITLRDAVFLTNPKTDDLGKRELIRKIIDGDLAIPYTWETEISASKDKKATWEQLIDSGRFPFMAMLRNLRNILDAGVSNKHLEKVAATLASEEAVLKSKQLPFRFLSAYREIRGNNSTMTTELLEALEAAIRVSAANIKGFDSDTNVAIACDVSGSMQTSVSPKSKIENYDIGLILGMLLQSRCKSVVSGMFGDEYKTLNLPRTNILQNVENMRDREGEVGYSTNGHLVLRELAKSGQRFDKVMMFTDCQMWNSRYGSSDGMKSAWTDFKKVNPDAKLYLFDLSGYGNTPLDAVSGGDVFLIAGWSDKVFDMLTAYENGSSAITKIREIVV